MNAQITTSTPTTPVLFNWNALTEAEAFVELARRLGVMLIVKPDGGLSASGNPELVRQYLADIAGRYRGQIIAHLLHLPPPEIETDEQVRQEQENILATAQALDVTIADYCRAARHPDEYRDRLLEVRRRMAAAWLAQNLCAFRWWLAEVQQ